MINPFLDACGATGPLLLSAESPGQTGGETRAFDLPFVVVGRDLRCDLRLDHTEVSDRHAYLQLCEGRLLWVDLGSRNGVHQGGKCGRLGDLEREQSIRIGPFRVRFLGGQTGHDPWAVTGPGPALGLELSHRSVRRTRSDLPTGLSLVGSASDCAVRVVDPSVSNVHCSLVHTEQGVWVVDLLGRDGVKVNGQEISYARLFAGDVLQIGHSEIRLSPGSFLSPNRADRGPIEPPVVTPPNPSPTRSFDDFGTPSEVGDDAPFHFPSGCQAPPCQTAAHARDVGGLDTPRPEPIERLIGPAVAQIAMMQQQMMEEFQRAQAAMYETFASIHDEQTSALKLEIEQVRRIGQELMSLRTDADPTSPSRAASVPQPEARRGTSIARAATPAQGSDGPDGRSPSPTVVRVYPEADPVHPHDEQAHAVLCQRIVGFKQKQKSLLEKVLTAFPSGLQGKTTL